MRRWLLAVGLGGLLLAGCTEAPRSIDEALGGTGSPSASTPTPTPSATPTAAVSPVGFPKTCGELVPSGALTAAVGSGRLAGESTFVYAGPVAASGRLERTTCGYGVAKDVPRLEVSLVRYKDEAAAAERIAITTDAALARGNQVREQPLRGRPGYVVRDRESLSFLVVDGDRTLVVTVATGVVPAPAQRVAAVELAQRVLRLQPTPAA